MAKPYRPRVVVAVHGILSHAYWYRRLAEALGDHRIPVRFFGYGHFSLLRLLSPWSRRRVVDRFRQEYEAWIRDGTLQLNSDYVTRRPSVIAHSFGTYIVGYCMQKYDYVKFDKVLLCGSILPTNFDWVTLFAREQLNMVRNEYSKSDLWSRLVGWVVPGTGPTGHDKFVTAVRRVEQEPFRFFFHGNYFAGGHIRTYWLPFLRRNPVDLAIRHGAEMPDEAERHRILEQKINRIDGPAFRTLPGYGVAGPSLELSLRWMRKNSDTYTFLLDPEGNLVGYINAIPVEENFFESVKQGLVKDSDIKPEHIVPYDENKRLKVYLTSIAMTPGLRPSGRGPFVDAVDMLIDGYLAKLASYAERGVQVTEVTAVAWTQGGKGLCKSFGMQPTGYRALHRYDVYLLEVRKASSRMLKRFPRLGDLLNCYAKLDGHL